MKKLFYWIALAMAISACSQETLINIDEPHPATLLLYTSGTRTENGSTEDGSTAEDCVIRELRVFIFHSGGGGLAWTAYIDNIATLIPANTLRIDMMTGMYDFAFIANEGSDPALAQRLAEFGGNLAALEYESFAAEAFQAGRNIPMAAVYRNIHVTEERAWNVELERLGIRFDLQLTTEEESVRAAAHSLIISHIPAQVFIGGKVNNTGRPSDYAPERTIPINDANNIFDAPIRIILPENIFAPVDDESLAFCIELSFDEARKPAWTTFGLSDGGDPVHAGNHTAPRNQIFRMWGNILDGGLIVLPEPPDLGETESRMAYSNVIIGSDGQPTFAVSRKHAEQMEKDGFILLPDMQGVLFKGGSLVAISGAYDRANTAVFSTEDVVFDPRGLQSSYSYSSIPWMNSGVIDNFNTTAATGDICRYISSRWDPEVYGRWRIPIESEWSRIVSTNTPANRRQWIGTPETVRTSDTMGTERITRGVFVSTNSIAGLVTEENIIDPPDKATFLPYGGVRDNTGTLSKVGSEGNYWTSAASVGAGYIIMFQQGKGSNGFYPNHGYNRAVATTIRCIRYE